MVRTNANEDRYTFFVEWYDQTAELFRRYQLTYFLRDGTLEMYDIKNRRPFLKRCEFPGVTAEDLSIGSTITVYSRQLKIVEYADEFTRTKLETLKGRTLAMIKPDAYNHIGEILTAIVKAGFVIKNLRMCKLDRRAAEEFYRDHKGKSFFDDLIRFVTSDAVVAIELWGDGAVTKWRQLVEGDLRPRFGTDATRNAVHGSDSAENATREIDFFFGSNSPAEETAIFNNCTCCVIRPHVANTPQVGEIVQRVLDNGFEIAAMRWCTLDKRSSEEFLEVYSGVLPEYTMQVNDLCGGPSLALEIRQESAVEAFRKFVGPHDPQIAKALRPGTLRAAFGIDRVKNAVHCTDLEEDGQLEVE
ncbi:nucleoside diphosphate kinase, putative [Perkinsus marinus ATCC 50983]|uniref:Nucleoside diphosphate kinase, putative n=1 Tax=Perkinsus marinus (strain ATCC 50983 / TXsc) TaxID=423536 RepID=C5LC83_PERM5|nr:nucleoside diphosphate kinase, putative [Perkinsus marinus ATCC 50983]EER05566.1 nucleoside diphosphate kinase, putative [Perkinsus marinus ATCC 50983]|eukprot:XP_002773750.1 nucleoside diphosphate kinase, putative [Perkinsus marinus ATCC 50983]